jgi:hypothetical protein
VELDGHPFGGQGLQEPEQIPQVPGQAVDGVDVQGVPLADVLQAGLQLRPCRVRRAGLVLKDLVQGQAVELPAGALVQARDADVAHGLAAGWRLGVLVMRPPFGRCITSMRFCVMRQ